MKAILRLRKEIFYGLYYTLIIIWIVLLSIRYWKSPLTMTRINPGFPLGGWREYSKSKCYKIFAPQESIPFSKTITIKKKDALTKKTLKEFLQKNKMKIPLVLKPNEGFQSIGVKVIHSLNELFVEINKRKQEQVIQTFCPYPFELGVFYYKYPSQKKGTIIGVNQKIFPFVIGDGKRTIRQLARKKIKISTEAFIKKQYGGLEYIPQKGERVQITSMYKKKSFITQHKDLTYYIQQPFIDAIEDVSKNAKGFYFGRYDIKTSDIKACIEKGKKFKIIEVNAGAYATPLYAFDYRYTFFRRLYLFAKAMKKAFSIGLANKDAKIYSFKILVKEYSKRRKQKFAKL
jgi:hypothetical protein